MTQSATKLDKPQSLQATQHGGQHYKDLAIEPAEYNHRNKIPFCAAEAIKYLTRHAFKGGAVDVKKAMHFVQMILEFDYGIVATVAYSDDQPVPAQGAGTFVACPGIVPSPAQDYEDRA